jgi:hypothetical protein
VQFDQPLRSGTPIPTLALSKQAQFSTSIASFLHSIRACRQDSRKDAGHENAGKIGISVLKPGVSLDRRVSVAPVMDWTDDLSCGSLPTSGVGQFSAVSRQWSRLHVGLIEVWERTSTRITPC